MKTKILLAISFVVAIMASCDGDIDGTSYSPTFKGFQYYTRMSGVKTSNGAVYPLDSLYVIVCQNQLGHLINAVNYNWYLVVDTNTADGMCPGKDTLYYYKHTNYDGYDNGKDDPVAHFLIPASVQTCNAVVVFDADYHFSGGGTMSSSRANIVYPYLGDYLTSETAAMYGAGRGRLTFTITKR